ncbi:hypothetical protein [Bythopirellula polymerisocia]|uniref:Fructose-bisphosphate aldolase n=1 Tax=Bythopirellula polymerisocia TaxID=2528003 RepID=A0A5C6CXG1_9BACT|nr:hypothetical protein [Bythopirellula polymerisocia]TWU29282.1 hypothetical protein Pla144_00580 [Bythopirellula polymerisocia]
MQKSLDEKLKRIAADPSCKDFVLADAKDADMAAGVAAPGKCFERSSSSNKFRSLQDYREMIRSNVEQGLVDIMLMSASTSELLTFEEKIFDRSAVTPAVRLNDTTDIWLQASGNYKSQPSLPFRSTTLEEVRFGKTGGEGDIQESRVNLGLYSITFNNDSSTDVNTLSAYKEFRTESEEKGIRHFLEVFAPNCPQAPIEDLPRFVNDSIIRTLAGITRSSRPLFLKIPYFGPAAMEQLVSYDSSLVVGILGGAAGTTFDAFHQLWEARKYGAKAALYGRMINESEHQLTFIQHLRWLADAEMTDPKEAVRSYHGSLAKLGIEPFRDLESDLRTS